MKTFKLFTLAIAVCSVAACSDDDASNGNNNANASISGTYNLTAVLAPEVVDYNTDGVGNSDMMLESPCYGGSKIVLNADGTYELQNNTVLFDSETGCFGETTSGEWEMDGSDLQLTNTSMDVPLTTEYDLTDNEIRLAQSNGVYPMRDAEGNAVYGNGAVTYIYTKSE